jgi:hypothetical protein
MAQPVPTLYTSNASDSHTVLHPLIKKILSNGQTSDYIYLDIQTPEGYISKDIYIPYPIQKSGKRIFSYPFFEWDMLKDIYPYFRDIHIFIFYPILYPFFSTNLNFAAFFSFVQFSFCLRCCGEFSIG